MSHRPKVLWADVPDNKRVTEEYLRDRYKPGHFLNRILEAQRTSRCPAATKLFGTQMWKRCQFKVEDGDTFCWYHGGTNFYAKRELRALQEKVDSLAERLQSRKVEVERLEYELADAQSKLEAFKENGGGRVA